MPVASCPTPGLPQCGPGTANLASTLPGGIWVPVMAETHRGKQTDTTEFVSLKYEYQALLRMLLSRAAVVLLSSMDVSVT